MALIKKDYQVIYVSRLDNTFRVWNELKTKYRALSQSKRGLYYTGMGNWGTVMTLVTAKEKNPNIHIETATELVGKGSYRRPWGTSGPNIFYT